jgi:hypothetical protein
MITFLLYAALVAEPTLSPKQVYDLARSAGFDQNRARIMTAIAMRESSLRPQAVYCDTPRECSFGLWQINVRDPYVWSHVKKAAGTPQRLKNGRVNAQAAFALWGGDDDNMVVAWSLHRKPYREWFYDCLMRVRVIAALERW